MALGKSIMERAYLEKPDFKEKVTQSLKRYKKYRNFYSRLYKKKLKKYFEILDVNQYVNQYNRQQNFFKKHPTFFSEKRKLANKIILEYSEENIISDDALVSEEPNIFFQNLTKTLNINENSYTENSSTDPGDKTINTYGNQ